MQAESSRPPAVGIAAGTAWVTRPPTVAAARDSELSGLSWHAPIAQFQDRLPAFSQYPAPERTGAIGARSRFQSCTRSWAFGSGTARPPPQGSSFSCTGGVWSGSVRSCGGLPTASQLEGPPPREGTRPPVTAGAMARRSHTPLAEDAGFEPARSQQRNLAFPRCFGLPGVPGALIRELGSA